MALPCRGVVLRLFGFELVKADGAPASRLRHLLRAAIAWSPLFAGIVMSHLLRFLRSFMVIEAIQFLALVVLAAGAAYALVNPVRGIQDRPTGTWIVPR